MTKPPLDLVPVRRRLTLLRDGSASSSSIVFCGAQMRSVSLEHCASRPHGGVVRADRDGWPAAVGCACSPLRSTPPENAPSPPSSPAEGGGGGVERVAASLPVGLALTRPVLCVRDDVPLRAAARVLHTKSVPVAAPVVDARGRLVGLLPRWTAQLGLDAGFADSIAMDHAREPTLCVEERETLGAAFTTMGARHVRELVVLGDDRQVVGTLCDIDALRFVAHIARTGLRPAPGWAA
jgi:CBS domain-containing protein